MTHPQIWGPSFQAVPRRMSRSECESHGSYIADVECMTSARVSNLGWRTFLSRAAAANRMAIPLIGFPPQPLGRAFNRTTMRIGHVVWDNPLAILTATAAAAVQCWKRLQSWPYIVGQSPDVGWIFSKQPTQQTLTAPPKHARPHILSQLRPPTVQTWSNN